MLLKDALVALARRKLDDDNDWYCWRIRSDSLPQGVSLPVGNPYARNVALKLKLHELWGSSDEERRLELAKYYVANWGGVKRNNPATLRRYVTQTPSEIIQSGAKGVASWSKVLCIRDPDRYAIFDARVSISLNCLQVIHDVESPEMFPLLAGQNKTIQRAAEYMQEHRTQNKWKEAAEDKYYLTYLSLLKDVVALCGAPNTKIYTVEMLLFAIAESLLSKAFPDKPF